MKIRHSNYLIMVSIIILASCSKSVLSELEIDSASLLKVKVKIDEKRKKKRQLQVTIRDKTNHPVEFSNGGVFVNQEPTEFSSKTVISTSRGYNYRIPPDVHEFEITIYWNDSDSHTFMIDKDAGFPGFGNFIGWNITQGSENFTISPAPFAGNKIEVEYDIM